MIEVIIPGEAPSTPNLREHHMARARRVKAQRAKVMAKVPTWGGWPLLFVRLTRVAPRRLDSDNLAGALKGHRDAVAARLRVDDASPLVGWEYQQATGEPAVVVQIWASTEEAPAHVTVITPLPKKRGMSVPSVGKDRKKPCGCLRSLGRCEHGPAYCPPRTVLPDAAQQAEETFAPTFRHHAACNHEGGGLCSCPPGWKG